MANKNNRVKTTNDIELKDRLVAINRVTKVTKGGRTFTFAAIVVVGNEDGIVGWGLGKANEVTAAIALKPQRRTLSVFRCTKAPSPTNRLPNSAVRRFCSSPLRTVPV